MSVWEAIIKVCHTDSPDARARDIAEGIGYAACLLMDEYGWDANAIAELFERVADDVADQEAMRA